MKKILMSLLVIGVSLGMLGAGTFSFFSDTEIAENNTFAAGTIDISVTGEFLDTYENPWTYHFELEEAKPCETRYIEFNIKNEGQNPCVIWKHIEIIDELNNIESEPEREADPSGTVNDISTWILYDLIINDVEVFVDEDELHLGDIACMWIPLGQILLPGETMNVVQSYHLDPDTGNEYQGDKLWFTISLFAQQRLGDGPTQISERLFLDDKTGEPDWYFIANDRWAILDWDPVTHDATLYAHGLDADEDYSLITYVDPWPGTVTKIVDITTDADGIGYIDGFSVPSGYSGKIWLILSDDYDFGTNTWNAWHETAYLYESNLVTTS